MSLDCPFVDADCPPASKVSFELGFVVDEASLLQHDVAILPAVDIVGPFA